MANRLSLPAHVVLLSLVLLGCGNSATPDAGAPTDVPAFEASVDAGALLEPGTGQLQWEPLQPSGNRLELIHGPQGGYHVFGRVRYRQLGPDVYLSFRVTPTEGGGALNDANARIRLREGRGLVRVGADTWETSSAQLVILDAIRGPQEVVGRRFRLEFTVQRFEAPETASAAVEIEIVDES